MEFIYIPSTVFVGVVGATGVIDIGVVGCADAVVGAVVTGCICSWGGSDAIGIGNVLASVV